MKQLSNCRICDSEACVILTRFAETENFLWTSLRKRCPSKYFSLDKFSEIKACDISSHCESFKINGKLHYLSSSNMKMHTMGTLCEKGYPLTLFGCFVFNFILTMNISIVTATHA